MDNKSQKTLEMVNIVPVRSSIEKLQLSESLAIKNFCEEYTKKLNEGLKEEQICEQFIADLAKVVESENDKAVLNELNEAFKANETNIKLANSVHNMSNSSCMFVKPMIESVVVDYMLNKNSENRDNVRVNVSLFESDRNVQDILEELQYEQYEEKRGEKLLNVELKESFKEPEVKTYTQEEVDKILSDKVNETKDEIMSAKMTRHSIENHIGLGGIINKILKESNNEKLRVFCERYISALNEGKADELLYESFISGISNWNYLSAVDTELSALKDRVSKYKQDIDLKKILEMMAQTGSYYIVPLIEDVVADYALNKNMATRAVLLQRLESFEYDPFVRDMEALITRDLSIENTVYLGESVEYLNSQVKSEQIFSPVNYIKENECVFNVKGTYYARKGNSIAKLTKNEVADLNESFKSLCNLVNADNVKLNKDLNTISIYSGNNKSVITESEIIINNKEVTIDELKKLTEAAINMRSDDAEFYAMTSALNEHYNDIAPIDFVKHIEARDNSGKSCDVFKLKESIFVNTTDKNLGRSTFYRNVNPIQCRKYINEHMEINCGPLFENELPDQDKIEKGIAEKKKEYQDYIDSLEDKKDTLEKMKDEGADTDDIDKAIAMIDQELDDTKADFKKYQEDSDKYLNGDKDDADTDSVDPENDDDQDNDDNQNGETDKDNDTDDTDNKEDNQADKDLDPEKETPEEMEKPLDQEDGFNAEDTGDDGDPAEYEFPEEFADVAEYDPDFDIPTEVTRDEAGQSTGIDYGRFQIVNVAYNKNVKTGTSNGKGEVIILIPSVDANGDVHNDTRKVSFYLDPEKKPVINNEYMPLDMYQAIVDAIENDPTTETITPDGAEVESDVKISDFVEPDEEDVKVEDNGSIVLHDDETKPEEPVDTEVKDEIKETPAETKATEKEVAKYPITVGLVPDEIKPITMDDFEKDLDDKMGIEHSKNEANTDEVLLKIKNKAQAYALRKYFNEWHGYNDEAFNDFMPELQACFDNKPANIDVMPTNESAHDRFLKYKKYLKESLKGLIDPNDGGLDPGILFLGRDIESEGFKTIHKNGKVNYIDGDGNILSDTWFDFCYPFENGIAVVWDTENDKYNYINTNGDLMLDTWLDEVSGYDSENDMWYIKKDGKYYSMTKDGTIREYLGECVNNKYHKKLNETSVGRVYFGKPYVEDTNRVIGFIKEFSDDIFEKYIEPLSYEYINGTTDENSKLFTINLNNKTLMINVPLIEFIFTRCHSTNYLGEADKICIGLLLKEIENVYNIKIDPNINEFYELFVKWMSYANNNFKSLFEGVHIKSAKMINEGKKFRVLLPNTQELCEMFKVSCDGNVEQFELIPENKEEEFKIYEKLYEYALAKNGDVEQDVIDILESHTEYGKLCESQSHYKLTVPYNNFLEQKLSSKGINVDVVNENMTADIAKSDFNKAKKVLESFYGEAAPTEARDFFQFLCENVTITVKDDTTGKTVTINTDDFNGKGESSAENSDVAADFDDSFKNVTFNPEESLAFKDDEESADDDKDDKEDKKENKDSENVNAENEGTEDQESKEAEDGKSDEEDSKEEHSEESSEENDGSDDKKSEDEKPKKKFKFKVKKKAEESLKTKDGKAINESTVDGLRVAQPNVLDLVKCKDGNKGQVIAKQADGNFIVNVMGRTITYAPSELTLEHVRFDLVDCPFKYDEKTLCGIYESFINCGLFVNNTQVTPNDCRVQLLEWIKAKDEDEIDIILEGEHTKAMKKFIRVTESLDDVMDLTNYAKATFNYIVEGKNASEDVLVNIRDYQRYMMVNESYSPVRALVFDEDGTTHMKNVNGGNITICESEGYIKPENNSLLESAVNALS